MVRVIEHCWIPLPDGTRLAAKLWLPDNAEHHPVPAILEYLPYRKNDGTAQTDPVRHAFFAEHGYAGVRVDIRGSGDAEGLMFDEYHPQEALDAVAVIAWLGTQVWCNGKVGMIGISWGGFNALQVAALRPPALSAIVSVAGTDDRYADDVHYLGGCVLARDALTWPTSFTSILARPPDPHWRGDEWHGEAWRAQWLMRLQAMPHFAAVWLQHQTRDDYWRQGSVCEDFSAITCPVYAIGGWADAYTNAVPRLLAGLKAPRKGLIGPWAHNWPNVARPGPAIGFLTECLRWWDHWLKGVDTGIMAEPMLRVWLQEWVVPANYYRERPGRWVAEDLWPAPPSRIVDDIWYCTSTGVARDPESAWARDPLAWEIATSLAHGQHGGAWCPFGMRGDYPDDQRDEDARALTFDTPPTSARVEILGNPEVVLELTANQKSAQIIVRLCDVAPDGASLLVSRGVLNLNQLLQQNDTVHATVTLDLAGHALPAGHRWRVALAPSYWPMVWPTAQPVTLRILGGALHLPARIPDEKDGQLTAFAAPDGAAALPVRQLADAVATRAATFDPATQCLSIVQQSDNGRQRFPHGLEVTSRSRDAYIIHATYALAARLESTRTWQMQRHDWCVSVTVDASITCDRDAFIVRQSLRAQEGDVEVHARQWFARIARQQVAETGQPPNR